MASDSTQLEDYGHPPGLWVLFITEMWERFSYYGMRALLVLFLFTSTAERLANDVVNANPGFGWNKPDAYTLYGIYTFMVYLTAIFGGIVADRLLGTHRSMIVGGWTIAAGHVTLAVSALFEYTRGEPVSLENGYGALVTFLIGLTLIIIGTGFFKPCVSVMVGQLYKEGDPRRDSGFTIFYMGINLGAFLSPLIAGYLGEKIGWHWGFGSAAVGMLLGLIFYQMYRPRYLVGVGDPPRTPMDGRTMAIVASAAVTILAIPVVPLLLFVFDGLGPIITVWNNVADALGVYGMAGAITGLIVAAILAFLFVQPSKERGPLAVIFILALLGNIFFWTAFEQAGSSMNIFALENTDRTLWGLYKGGFPASWYQAVNPLTILLFGSVFSWLWVALDKRNANPSTPMKFAIGLWLLGLAFLAMVFGSLKMKDGGLVGPHWLLITYVVVTWGELCLSPVGLSMVTKLAPQRLQSLMMGFWFFTFALSNFLAGLVARFSTRFTGDENKEADLNFIIEGLPGFFLMLVVFPIGAGVVILLISPLLKRMMQGVK